MRGALGYLGCVLIMLAVSCFWYYAHFRKREEGDKDELDGDISMGVYGAEEDEAAKYTRFVEEMCADKDADNRRGLVIA